MSVFFIETSMCNNQVDLCFIVDSSGSIRDNNPADASHDNWDLQLNFIIDLVKLFDIAPDATRVGLVVFSDDAQLVFSLDTYTDAESLEAAIRNIPYSGHLTNTRDAFRNTREQCFNVARGDRPGIQNLAIFISDGQPFPGNIRDPAITEAQLLKNSGAFLIAVGITPVIDLEFLKTVSSSPQIEGQNYFRAPDFSALQAVKRSVGEGTCEVITGTDFFLAFLSDDFLY